MKPNFRKQKPKPKTRKELRKEKRQQKKLNRFNYHNVKRADRIKINKKQLNQHSKKEDEYVESENEEFDDEEIPSSDEEQIVQKPVKSSQSQLEKFLEKQKKEQDEYFNEIKSSRIEQLKQANEEEDKIIGRYEKLLKLNKKKRKDGGMSKFNDGLDYLLELCTDDSIQKMYQAAKEADEVESKVKMPPKKKRKMQEAKSESSDDEKAEISSKSERLKKIEEKYFGDDEDFFKNNPELDSCDGSDSELDEGDFESQDGSETEENEPKDENESELDENESGNNQQSKNASNLPSDDENSSQNNQNDQSDFENEASDDFASDSDPQQVKEDIYGRKIDKSGKLIQEDKSKYVPPHLRKSLKSIDSESDPKRKEKLQNLKRQVNGFINRLAETNLHRISIDIENLYSSNARNDMNTVLTEVLQNSLISNVLSRERSVLEQTLLVAVLHANIGSEIGAFFLQILVERFDKLFSNIDSVNVEDKELDNVIFSICHLYTYKLFKHNIIYEILDKLCSKLTEKRIECILLVLKSIGFILRKDDPVALKEFILKAQKMLSSCENSDNSRVTYMLDVLMAIKNNNMTKIPQYDASLVEHFRKLLKQFVRSGKYVTTLAMTLDDLLNVEERGKWWLVGSAWAGNESKDGASTKKNSTEADVTDELKSQIMALAKKQRMNTDTKRSVFYIIMTADDYLDAFEKILSVTNDERTIISVILHCCMSEKEYNEYYSVLSQKFCEHNRKFMLAVQFSIYDKIKEIQSLNSKQINNLSRFLIFLIENDNLPLSVLKVVEFTQIEKTSLRFVRQIMLGLLLTKEENFERVFERIAPSLKLNAFKDQLRLFLKIFLLKDSPFKMNEEQMAKLETRIQQADKFLAVRNF